MTGRFAAIEHELGAKLVFEDQYYARHIGYLDQVSTLKTCMT